MIQFNLLPDVKIAYIKAERQKKLVMSISVIASIAAIVLFVLLFSFVQFAQKKNMNDLTRDIEDQSVELTETKDLNQILTVQNQLNALEGLHGQKLITSRTFDYIEQVTPPNVSISQMDVDFTLNTIQVNGSAASLAAVNAYADSLKQTQYTLKGEKERKYAFKDVVLSSFSVSEQTGPQYTFTLGYDPVLFAQDSVVTLVPSAEQNQANTESPRTEEVFQGGATQ